MAKYGLELNVAGGGDFRGARGGRKFAKFLSAFALLAYGAGILTVYAFGVPEGANEKPMWLIGLLVVFGLSCLFEGTFGRAPGSFYMAWAFLWCAAVVVAGSFTDWGYAQIYPAFILTPAVASAATWIFSRAKNSHLKVIIFFGAVSAVFFLNSVRDVSLSWWLIGGILIVAFALMHIANVLVVNRGKWDDGDHPERRD